jgi:hypothetical protein
MNVTLAHQHVLGAVQLDLRSITPGHAEPDRLSALPDIGPMATTVPRQSPPTTAVGIVPAVGDAPPSLSLPQEPDHAASGSVAGQPPDGGPSLAGRRSRRRGKVVSVVRQCSPRNATAIDHSGCAGGSRPTARQTPATAADLGTEDAVGVAPFWTRPFTSAADRQRSLWDDTSHEFVERGRQVCSTTLVSSQCPSVMRRHGRGGGAPSSIVPSCGLIGLTSVGSTLPAALTCLPRGWASVVAGPAGLEFGI